MFTRVDLLNILLLYNTDISSVQDKKNVLQYKCLKMLMQNINDHVLRINSVN